MGDCKNASISWCFSVHLPRWLQSRITKQTDPTQQKKTIFNKVAHGGNIGTPCRVDGATFLWLGPWKPRVEKLRFGKNREIPGGDSHPGCHWHPGLRVDPSLKQKLTSMETFKFLGEFQPLDFLGVWVVNRFITSGSCEKSVQKFLKGIDFDKFVHLSLSQIIFIFAPQPKVNHWVNTSRERAFQGRNFWGAWEAPQLKRATPGTPSYKFTTRVPRHWGQNSVHVTCMQTKHPIGTKKHVKKKFSCTVYICMHT